MTWKTLVICWLVRLFLFKIFIFTQLQDDFLCKEEFENQKESGPKTLIISDDAMVLFENQEGNIGKIEFWATLYSLTDVQINKMTKSASMNFFNDESNSEKKLKLKIDNILFFREALVKRMNNLKVKVESKKIIKGQCVEKRLTDKEINTMSITDAVKNIDLLVEKIKGNEVNFYVVNTFMRLVGRVNKIIFYFF